METGVILRILCENY